MKWETTKVKEIKKKKRKENQEEKEEMKKKERKLSGHLFSLLSTMNEISFRSIIIRDKSDA